MILTVTTCGTSLLTNGLSNENKAFLNKHANKKFAEYSKEEFGRLEQILQEREEMISREQGEENLRKMSAELNGLIGYYRKNSLEPSKDCHWLICTDTYQGEKTAELIKNWGSLNGYNMSVYKANDLNTGDAELFKIGMDNLVNWCEETLPGYRDSQYKIVFNLVGGFKILQGYMQTLGMFYADESIYIFEGTSEILSIPRLPMDFSENFKTDFEKNINIIRAMQWRAVDASDCKSLIPESMFCEIDNKCTLSTWGNLMLNRVRNEIYSKKLFSSPSPLIQYSQKVEKIAKDLDGQKLIRINKKIDDLARYFENGKQPLKSLDFKALKGSPKLPATHEFDLWADDDVWRGFGYFEHGGETGVFVINEVGEALH